MLNDSLFLPLAIYAKTICRLRLLRLTLTGPRSHSKNVMSFPWKQESILGFCEEPYEFRVYAPLRPE